MKTKLDYENEIKDKFRLENKLEDKIMFFKIKPKLKHIH